MAAIGMALRYGMVVAVAGLALGTLNALPGFVGGEPRSVVRYASVADAEAHLGVPLYRPAAVPAPWHWPPSRVRAAFGRPGWVEFDFEGDPDVPGMVICQTFGETASDVAVSPVLLPAGTLLEQASLAAAGSSMRMQRMLLDDGSIVHEVWWREATRRVMLRARVAGNSLPALANAVVGNR